jgi:hypothetical protein
MVIKYKGKIIDKTKANRLLNTKKFKNIDLRNPKTKLSKQGRLKNRMKKFVRFHTRQR